MLSRSLSWLTSLGLVIATASQGCSAELPADNGLGANNPTTDTSKAGTFRGDGKEITNVADSLASCATAKGDARKLPVYMQIVLDGSGSMDINDPVKEADRRDMNRNHGTKWIAARDALINTFDDMAQSPDPSLVVGMYLFESTTKKPANQVDVPIAVVDAAHATQLKNRIMPPVFGDGGTPMCTALSQQSPILKSYAPPSTVGDGGKRVLVLITDGVPSENNCDTGRVLDIVRQQSADGTKFFAIGVGDPSGPVSDYDPAFMGDIATAGNTATEGCTRGWTGSSPANQKPCHFQVTPGARAAADVSADFKAAIEKIRESVNSCEYALEKPAGSGPLDLTQVNVVFTDASGKQTTILQDGQNGWTYDNASAPKSVQLHGAACTQTKSSVGKVSIVVGCMTQVAR